MRARVASILRFALATVAVGAATTLVARAWLGPFSFGLSVRSPMNAESILAAASLLLLLLPDSRRSAAPESPDASSSRSSDALALATLAIAILACFWPSLSVGLLADDYAHLLNVSQADSSFFLNTFTVPAADRFFRPLGMISYLIDFQWAGFSPLRWHVAGLLWHLLNSMLVYLLCRALSLPAPWALFGAAFFALHGSRPEAVTWVAARFDLLATCFVLVALLIFLAYTRRPTRLRLALFLAATAAGLLSKESAYVLPLLLAVLLAFFPNLRNYAARRAAVACAVLTAAVFCYRWTLLNGIGGYEDPSGRPTILLLNAWLLFKALALRLWAVLLFPINWTDPLDWPIKVTLSLMVLAIVVLALRKAPSRLAAAGLALALVAALPVYHLLQIGPDLEKSRVIYLSSAAFAFSLAAILQHAHRPVAVVLAVAILAFQAVALNRNLQTWNRVAELHAQACDAIASEVRTAGTDVLAVGMPITHDGVYMLKTGLPECIEIRHRIPARRLRNVPALPEPAHPHARLPAFEWNAQTAAIQRVSGR